MFLVDCGDRRVGEYFAELRRIVDSSDLQQRPLLVFALHATSRLGSCVSKIEEVLSVRPESQSRIVSNPNDTSFSRNMLWLFSKTG